MTKVFHIEGIGSYIPAKILTNNDLSQLVDTTDEWIVTRTGIKLRHLLEDHENVSDAGTIAARRALKDSGIPIEHITHIVVATCTPDYLCPSTACIISNNLGIENIIAFDINAACSGFIYGLHMLQYAVVDPNNCVLFICSEALSRRTNWNDRRTCVLFGDGAGAVVLRGQKSSRTKAAVQDSICYANGKYYNLLCSGGGTAHKYKQGDIIDANFFINMEGQEIFKHAVRNLTNVCQDILARNHLSLNDIDLFIPHQANQRIIESLGNRLSIPIEKIFINVDRYGNTSAASIPLAMVDAITQKRIEPGMRILIATFGGGLTWGAAILNF